MHPMLKAVQDQIALLKASGLPAGQIAQIIAQLVNSPILAAAVASTPTPLDDIVLALLKGLFPAPALVA